jgi:hypothetical protein
MICASCKEPARENEKLLRCGRCKKVWYHDVSCQRRHFKIHKKQCKALAASFLGFEVVESNSSLGRVAISTQNFKVGDTVLAEVPALVCNQKDGYIPLFSAYLDSEPEAQASILDMYHGSKEHLDYREILVRPELARFQHKKKHLLTVDIAKKIVSIVNLNAHQYEVKKVTGQVYTFGEEISEMQMALYPLGSIPEHSCAPNVTSDTTELGLLHYQAIVPIGENERVTYSYMGSEGVIKEPRTKRRLYLQENKSFWCECKRCVDFDECNPFVCGKCNNASMFEGGGTGSNGYRHGIYYCLLCKHECKESDKSICKQIRDCDKLLQEMDQIARRLECGDLSVCRDCLHLQSKLEGSFPSHLHWIFPKFWKLSCSAFASQALMEMQQGVSPIDQRVSQILRKAGYIQLLEAKWTLQMIGIIHGLVRLEDILAEVSDKCDSNAPTDFPSIEKVNELIIDLVGCHPKNDQTASLIFHACQDLILGGEMNESVSNLLQSYYSVLEKMERLTVEEKNRIKVFIDSRGTKNIFPNHLFRG